MMFTLSIETDNAAFEPEWPEEVARILCALAERLRERHDAPQGRIVLHDINGNRVGEAACTLWES